MKSILTFCLVGAVAATVACAAKQLPREEPLAVSPVQFSATELREASNIIVVTDASGTMYQESTLPEAKALSASLVKALPDSGARARSSAYDVGVIGFGGDDRVKAPLAPFNRSGLLSTIDGLQPIGTKLGTGGTTPFRHVFDEIATDLDGRSGLTAVVIFSDGLADQPEYAATRAKALADGYTGGQLCFHAVQIGNEAAGEGFLRSVSGLTPCGSVVNAGGVGNSGAFSNFAKAVVVGTAPAVAAAPPSPGMCAGKIRLRGIEFGFDKANVDPTGAVVLDAAIDTLKNCPDIELSVDGHTDSIGAATYNKGLSERRAMAVEDYLSKNGVSKGRMTAKGHGLENPIASNDTRDGRARNRRVELTPR